MTVLVSTPDDINFLTLNNFRFFIKKTPTVNFLCQRANIPGIALVPADQGNPYVVVPYAGDHIEFQELVIKFAVDLKMKNYMEIHNWIRKLGFARDHNEYASIQNVAKTSGDGIVSDVELVLYDPLKNVRFDVIFQDAFPIRLSDLVFETTLDDAVYAYAEASFRYTLYDIKSVLTDTL
jgi:hypothetical protein